MIEPQVARRKIKVPRIDTENIEIGGVFGALSIEDFGTNPVYGATAAYHVTEDFFFQAEAGRSTAGKTSFETLGGNIQLLTNDERQFTYYNLALGYNFLPGEVFLGRNTAMTSGFFLMGGIGSVDFARRPEVRGQLRRRLQGAADGLARRSPYACRTASSIRTCWVRASSTNNLEANIGLLGILLKTLDDWLLDEDRIHSSLCCAPAPFAHRALLARSLPLPAMPAGDQRPGAGLRAGLEHRQAHQALGASRARS